MVGDRRGDVYSIRLIGKVKPMLTPDPPDVNRMDDLSSNPHIAAGPSIALDEDDDCG
jgi:hypothetical protein